MRGFFNGLLLGIILGVAGFWFLEKKAREHPEAEQRAEDAASQAKTSASETAHHLSEAFMAKLETLHLGSEQIKDEMARTGKIVRQSAEDLGTQVADATADARIIAAVKAKYAGNADLSVWKISVSCAQGHVGLSGTVSAEQDIGEAVAIALDTDGVRNVTSTLTVNPKP